MPLIRFDFVSRFGVQRSAFANPLGSESLPHLRCEIGLPGSEAAVQRRLGLPRLAEEKKNARLKNDKNLVTAD